MSWLTNTLKHWKAEFDVRRKEKNFINTLKTVPDIFRNEPLPTDQEVNFRHSGHAGDLVHAIPAMLALAGGRKINLYLHLGQPAGRYTGNITHPNGNVMFTQKTVELFAPLFASQPQFNDFGAYTGQNIHYDLSEFRAFPFDLRMGSNSRWYLQTFATTWDLGKKWLEVSPDNSFSDAIIVARTSRYRTPLIRYDFLARYGRIVFVGLPQEYEDMRSQLPDMEYKPVKNFLELAQVIAGGKLYISNQSMPAALAEALKVKRIIELSYLVPTTVVEGPDAYDVVYQPQFERIVKGLLGH